MPIETDCMNTTQKRETAWARARRKTYHMWNRHQNITRMGWCEVFIAKKKKFTSSYIRKSDFFALINRNSFFSKIGSIVSQFQRILTRGWASKWMGTLRKSFLSLAQALEWLKSKARNRFKHYIKQIQSTFQTTLVLTLPRLWCLWPRCDCMWTWTKA